MTFVTDSQKQLNRALRARNHKLRLEILELLERAGENGITVTELWIKLRIEQSVASQHLRILRDSGLVKRDRKGKEQYYSVQLGTIAELDNLAASWTALREAA